MIDIQDSLNEKMIITPESCLKKLYGQPLNGSSSITLSVSGGGIQTRIETPAGPEKLDMQELGYTYKWNNGAAVQQVITFANNGQPANTIAIPYLPVSYCSDFQRIEFYEGTSTNKWIDASNVTKYFKETNSLYNNFKERTFNQRFNFGRDSKLDFTGITAANAPDIAGLNQLIPSDGYLDYVNPTNLGVAQINTSQSTVQYYQQKYICLVDISYVGNAGPNGTGTLTLTPRTFVFNYKMKDLFHDSIYSRDKHLPHGSNNVLICYWNALNEMLSQMSFAFTATNNNPAVLQMTRTGPMQPYSRSETLAVSNIFQKYYMEQNPEIIKSLMSSEIDVVYPFLYQANINSSSNQNGCNLILGQEGNHRIYRIYTSLFKGSAGTSGSFYVTNNENISNAAYGNEKWDQNVELYFNNDLYNRLVVGYEGTGAGSYDDWKEYILSKFIDGSLNSSIEVEYHGTVIFDLDTSNKSGRKNEYSHNTLRGKVMDKQYNINPRFLNVKGPDGNQVYIQQLFAVVMRQAKIKGGNMTVY